VHDVKTRAGDYIRPDEDKPFAEAWKKEFGPRMPVPLGDQDHGMAEKLMSAKKKKRKGQKTKDL
jgi:hypothetical protein